jgi:signal transduction histidine kinase
MADIPELDKDGSFDAESLIAHLHEKSEADKIRLSRDLHDDLGGLLVSAVMDLSTARRRLVNVDPVVNEKLERIKRTLESAIDLGREMVEELRPSVLDNIGLFAALRCQLRRASRQSGAVCTESYPEVEPPFESDALTALFRIAQDALALSFKRGSIRSANLTVRIENDSVWMRFTDDGIPTIIVDGRADDAVMILSSMRHRIRAVGGTVHVTRAMTGETSLTAQMPLPKS